MIIQRLIDKKHIPVLLEEVIKYLDPKSNQNFIDCTIGGGGHAEEILKRTAPQGNLLGIDLDEEAIEISKKRLDKFKNRVIFVNDNFAKLKQIKNEHAKLYQVRGILFDLGLSTYLLQDKSRGFSFQVDGPLDMRFNKSQILTANQIINNWPKSKISRILWEYGQEKFAEKISQKIIQKREKQKFNNTRQLVEAVLLVYREKLKTKKEIPWVGGIHPATRTFQALRIVVNDELNNLKKALPQALDILKPGAGGRLAVISFHSGEDRIVKEFFKQEAKDCLCPPEWPVCQCGHQARLKILTKKPIVASDDEIEKNSKARSAKLRVAEKL